ncbi:MAG: DUF4215 domain-containing protein, partial [Patescibacteria group bacterium]|nr:DUF4215 domain-containing protein [Patescibacteria group bacterium]
YGRDDFVGNLKSGSFIPGYTTSKWQNSWGLLNSYAGTVSVDPVNQWVGCSDHDPLTCWNASSSTYKCPTFAEVYEYKFVSSTQSYNIYAPFEYLQSINDNDFVSRYIDQNKIIFGRSCTPEDLISYSTSNFTCGDGIVNYAVGEECEPPNSTKFVDRSATGGLCSPGTKALATCSPNNCKWSVSSSCNTYGAKACGDGILDSTYIVTTTVISGDLREQCDDGDLNGRYSHCDINCQKPEPGSSSYSGLGFCGDSISQPQYEYCEKTDDKYQKGFCELKKDLSCLTDDNCVQIDVPVASYCGLAPAMGGSRICVVDGTVEGVELRNCSTNADCEGLTYPGELDQGDCLFAGISNYGFSKQNSCSYDCSAPGGYCGDGITQWDYEEQCDDSNLNDNDNCKNNCTLPLPNICGNNVVEGAEECDDGNLLANDGCNSVCLTEGTCDYPDKNLVCTTNAMCPITKFPVRKVSLAPSQKVCMYENDLIYTPIDNSDTVKVYPCRSSSSECRTNSMYGIDTKIYSDNSAFSYINVQDDFYLNSNVSKINCFSLENAIGFVEDGDVVQCKKQSATSEEAPVCGNNKVDIGEQCDLGTQNGVQCRPEYGRSCTYCSNTCLVQTLEASQRCGNGIVDKDINNNFLEQCDYTLDNEGKQQFVFNRDSATLALSCDDTQRGVYQCTNNCQLVQNSCVTCGSGANLPVPKLAVLNTLTEDLLYQYHPDLNSGKDQTIDLYKKNVQNDMYDLLISEASYLPIQGFRTGISKNIFDGTNLGGIQNDQLCVNDYKIFVNKGIDGSRLQTDDLDLAEKNGYGSIFDYPYMPSDANEVENEIILNPKVLSGKMRVVIRWQKKNDIHFVGNVYSDTNIALTQSPYNIRYSEVAADNKLCSVMDISTCANYQGVGGIKSVFSEYVTGLFSSVQSVTFDSMGTVSTPVDDMDIFAFYVSALEAPINQLKDYDVWVDVYVGRGGSPYAYVKPDYSFSLNNAQPSNNATANYWHVFNIGRFSNQAIIIPISATEPISVPVSTFYGFYADISSGYNGAIATSLCQVKEKMPNTTKCQL